MIIRQATINDAEQLMNLIDHVESTSEFMLMEPGERNNSVEKQIKMIEHFSKQDNSNIFVADNGTLCGYLITIGNSSLRNKHSAYLVIGVHQDVRGQGVGTLLFEAVEQWVKTVGITRLELTVVTENEAGVNLYQKSGFEIEGTKRRSLKINNKFYDEYYMSKLV
ncbi:GNAT family N-acetyltransferase [Macrococcoides caseolyticum]|uniref:GNAT family N-acetyltransferase n=1 Tax=Macrococcoides caseolyticum TaxID=69966 RepID=UPI001F457FB9|nr:GNAT family protein [Macrococcus caseolyticus]MCE4956834.1 GNAT family N-acetyltransferase [Macrococcus caseolyticus]